MRARNITCCFTGHRTEKLPWGDDERDERCLKLKEQLHDMVERAYAEGYRHFICGMARGCDTYFCEEVLALRVRYQDVTVEAAIPCPGQSGRWSAEDRERYEDLLERCDYRTVVEAKYSPGCMQKRNRYMVDHAALLIAAFDGLPGGTRQTVEYAFSRKLNVLILPIPG